MIFENCCIHELERRMKGKRVACFGVSKHLFSFSENVGNRNWIKYISYFVDNNANIQGKEVEYFGNRFNVYAPQELRNNCDIIIIPSAISTVVLEIVRQLEKMRLPNTVKCYSLLLIRETKRFNNDILINENKSDTFMIEKKIHCFWFSKEKKPIEYQRCIDSWKRFCPDYQIIEWNANNYDYSKNNFMKKAYEEKMWAFVSDYARLDVIYHYGGIYMDMDVEVRRNIDDLLRNKAFFSFDIDKYIDLGSGFGSVKELPLIKKMLDMYENIDFDTRKLIPQPAFLLPVFLKFGYIQNDCSQIIDDVKIYSPDYFKIISDSQHEDLFGQGKEFAIHWHHAGWFDEKRGLERECRTVAYKELLKLFSIA